MGFDGKALAEARTRLEAIRESNLRKQERRTAEVYAKVPRIAAIDTRLRRQMAELAHLSFSREADRQTRLDALRDENLALQAERAELLVEHGWPISYLDEIISCPICRDTGTVDGAPCRCLKKLYNAVVTEDLSSLLRSGDENFGKFNLSLYSDIPDQNGVRPHEVMTEVLELAKEFAKNFPRVSSNLLLQGGTGLGKTFLSACIAREVADKGYSVCYDSAISALEACEQQKFSRDPDAAAEAARRVRQMLDCDLMILDDLGTELTTSLTLSSLYMLINTRLVNGKRSIISTNLLDEELERRYGQQIYSRLKGEFRSLPFIGQDIRLKK